MKKKKCQIHRLCTYSCQMYYSIILNTNTSQPMPQYYKWMYEEKKMMCDCCLKKLHCFFLPHMKTRLRISERPKKWKKNPKCAQSEKKKKREKKKLLLPF